MEAGIKELKGPLGDPADPAWDVFPDVMAQLCRRDYKGITQRDPGSLEIRCTDAGFHISVADFGIGTRVGITAPHLQDCLEWLQDVFSGRRKGVITRLRRGKGADRLKAEEAKALAAAGLKR